MLSEDGRSLFQYCDPPPRHSFFIVNIRCWEAEFLPDVARLRCAIASAFRSPSGVDFIVKIGVGEAEFLHDVALQRLHLLGFLILDMVIT